MADTCPCCGKFTSDGLRKFAEYDRAHPIYKTDLTKPLSQLIDGLRSDLVKVRGQLEDIGFGFTGWRDHLSPVEGLITCGLVTLYDVLKRMQEHEKQYPPTPQTKEPG